MAGFKSVARRHFLLASGSFLGAAGVDAGSANFARAAPLQPVNIVSTSGNLNLTLDVLMKRRGYLTDLGLAGKTINVADGTKIMGALIGGGGDLCPGSGFNQLFPAIAKGAQIKIIAGAQTLPDIAIFSKNPDIRRVKDLEGKTIGTGAPGALIYEAVVALLRKRGVDPKSVTFANIGSTASIFAAVAAGTIDAGPASSDVYEQQAKLGVHSLTDSTLWTELPEFTYQAAYTSDRTIAQSRDVLVRVLAAYTKLYRYVQGPNSKDAFISARTKVSGPASAAQGEAQWAFVQKYQPFALKPTLTEEQIDYVQRLNVELDVQKAVLPFHQVADMSLARDALKLIG